MEKKTNKKLNAEAPISADAPEPVVTSAEFPALPDMNDFKDMNTPHTNAEKGSKGCLSGPIL